MKSTLKILAALSLILTNLLSGCAGSAPLAIGKVQDWAFVQAAGGIDVGRPYFDKNHMFLPVNFDPAGRAVTTRPTASNPGLVCLRPGVRLQDGEVLITVRTTSAGSQSGAQSRCPPADLGKVGKIPAGNHDVYYLGPDGSRYKIGAIFI